MNKMCPCSINRRNVFGENLLYKAALHNDVDLVRCCIKNGGNVNQLSYAGKSRLLPQLSREPSVVSAELPTLEYDKVSRRQYVLQ